MHVRVASDANDFLLLSPTDPFQELGDYLCFDKELHWFFCKQCGGRCFTYAGEEENVEVDLGALGVPGEAEGKKTKVWKHKGGPAYLSVNGYAIDAGQDGLDLREWTEKKWLQYFDMLPEREKRLRRTYDRPHAGGAY